MRRIKLILAATALMVAMLAATAVPVMADDWDDGHFGSLHHGNHDHDHDFDDEVDVDVDVINLGRHVECLEITFEEEDHHGDEEDVEIVCFHDPGPIERLFG